MVRDDLPCSASSLHSLSNPLAARWCTIALSKSIVSLGRNEKEKAVRLTINDTTQKTEKKFEMSDTD